MSGFSVILLIRHPTIDPRRISEELGLVPYASARAGEPIVTPKGTVMSGAHQISYWNYVQRFSDGCSFSIEVDALVSKLERSKEFFLKIADEQAEGVILVRLPGGLSQGDHLNYHTLKKICDLRLSLGFEVLAHSS